MYRVSLIPLYYHNFDGPNSVSRAKFRWIKVGTRSNDGSKRSDNFSGILRNMFSRRGISADAANLLVHRYLNVESVNVKPGRCAFCTTLFEPMLGGESAIDIAIVFHSVDNAPRLYTHGDLALAHTFPLCVRVSQT